MGRWVPNRADIYQTSVAFAKPLVDDVLDGTLASARRRVPVRTPKAFDKRPGGRLRKSLRKRGPQALKTRVRGSVGSTLPYAASVHDGAQPHVITARRKPQLVFYWEREAVTFVGRRVNHPGVRRRSRTQYLWLPLTIVARRHGFAVRRLKPGIASSLAGI